MSSLIQAKSLRVFEKEQEISEHLFCTICQDVFQDPVRMICRYLWSVFSHTFCYVCITTWTSIRKNCPTCSVCIDARKPEVDLIARKMVDALLVRCAHEACSWKGSYSLLKKHQRRCQFKPHREQLPILNPVVVLDEEEVL